MGFPGCEARHRSVLGSRLGIGVSRALANGFLGCDARPRGFQLRG